MRPQPCWRELALGAACLNNCRAEACLWGNRSGCSCSLPCCRCRYSSHRSPRRGTPCRRPLSRCCPLSRRRKVLVHLLTVPRVLGAAQPVPVRHVEAEVGARVAVVHVMVPHSVEGGAGAAPPAGRQQGQQGLDRGDEGSHLIPGMPPCAARQREGGCEARRLGADGRLDSQISVQKAPSCRASHPLHPPHPPHTPPHPPPWCMSVVKRW